ncbi:hypothetical protein [Paractinoplanes brasiliensis]|uniref:hypothetical protein n=2 Tax=Paractinoplanes brasiliensis TaxID=52695 RepID=UPI00105DBF0D|nr:hypothetical protein [Actinoplanes brasiliensis]
MTADAVAALPARLKGRLDAAVEQARAWPVAVDGSTVTVRPDEKTIVTLTTPVLAVADAVCGCLLSPRCLHRAAVLSAAPIATALEPDPSDSLEPGLGVGSLEPGLDVGSLEPDLAGDPSAPGPSADKGPSADQRSEPGCRAALPDTEPQVSRAQRVAADGLRVAAAEMLAGGVPGGGAVTQASLLRAAHQARAAGLQAGAAVAVRVVEHLRAARREDPAFRRADLAADVRELLLICHRVAAGDNTAVGVARRDYQPVGDLRLFGLFCEPVRAATGHAGAVTYLADSSGRVWVVSDVKPAEPSVAVTATRASVDLGEARLSHHHLSRAGLRAINAHASAAGRLSHGRARQAVAAPGVGWFEEPLAALWRVNVTEQVGRWLAAAALPVLERPAAHDLAYLDGVVVGADRRGLLLAVGGRQVVAVGAPIEDPALPYVGNLRLLATHARGWPVRVAGRFTGPGTVDALALGAPWLPPSYGGHVDLGAQRLNRADVPAGPPGRAVGEAATTALEPTPGVSAVPGPTPGVSAVPGPTPGVGAVPGPTPGVGAVPGPTPGVGAVPGPTPGVGAVPGPTPGVSAVPGPTPGVSAVPGPTPGVGAVRESNPGVGAALESGSGVGGALEPGPAGNAGLESNPGVGAVPGPTPGVGAVREFNPGVGAALESGSGVGGALEPGPAGNAGPESNPGVGAVPGPTPGVGAVREFNPGVGAALESGSGVGGALEPGPAGNAGPERNPSVNAAPPLHLVRHQLERVVATGRAALLSGAEEDARRLSAAHLVTAAAVVRALGAAGVRRTRDVFGRLDPHDAERLADAWLTAAVYEQAATAEATRVAWG